MENEITLSEGYKVKITPDTRLGGFRAKLYNPQNQVFMEPWGSDALAAVSKLASALVGDFHSVQDKKIGREIQKHIDDAVKKVPHKITVQFKDNLNYSKGELGLGNKATDYQKVSFDWMRKKVKPNEARIRTRTALHNVWKPELNKIFGAHPGDLQLQPSALKAAESYAKELLTEGLADAVWIAKEIYINGYVRSKYVADWISIEENRWSVE